MTKTQDQIWYEMHSRMSAEAKERRDESRKDLLDIMVTSCAAWGGMDDNERGKWIEGQKALVNEYFRLRDKLAPRFVGREEQYQDDGVKSKRELKEALSDLEIVVNEINARVSLEDLNTDEREKWRETDPNFDVRRARDKLRWLSRLPQSDTRIDELLYQYRMWDQEAQERQLKVNSRMSRLSLIFSALFDPSRIISEQGKIAEVAKAEGKRDGLMLALWAFDYAPENADPSGDGSHRIPLPQLGTGFWRSGDYTP